MKSTMENQKLKTASGKFIVTDAANGGTGMEVKSCSYSSDKALARCEMKFHYKYVENLHRKIKSVGLFRGDWVHQLLEAKYTNKDWRKYYRTELVKKVWNKIFDEEKEEFIPLEIIFMIGSKTV